VGGNSVGVEALDRAGDGDTDVQRMTSTDGAARHRTGGMTLAQPALALLLLAGAPALAQDDVATGPVLATGGAAAAHAHDNGALTVNPAAIGLAERYAMVGSGSFWDGRDWRAGVVAVDNMTTEGFAMGVAYQHWRAQHDLSLDEFPGWTTSGDELPTKRTFHNITVGAALPMADDRFSIGVSGTLLFIDHAILGTKTSGDLEAGIAGRPTEKWSLGLGVRNILPRFFVTDQSIGIVAGTRYAWNDLTSVLLDVDVPLTAVDGLPFSVRTGAEFGQDLRHVGVGYRFEGPTSEHWASAGAGMWSDTAPDSPGGNLAGLHYAVQVPLHGMGSTKNQLLGIRHTLTLSIQPKKPR